MTFIGAEIDRLEIVIEAEANRASRQMDILIDRLDRISRSIGRINSSNIRNLGSAASTGRNGISGLSDGFNRLIRNTTKSTKSVQSFSQTAGRFYTNCFMMIRGIKKIGKTIESSMDYVETFNYFSVTMDKIGKEFGGLYKKYGKNSANSYAESFSGRLKDLTGKMTGFSIGDSGELTMSNNMGLGLDPEQIMSYQANIAAVTNSVGFVGESSVNTAKALTMLSADMSSLKNIDMKTVMTNFQSGLIGQSRALYKYGIDITNATLQTYAYKYGLQTAVSEMTQADKMQLRLLAILDQSKVAWGDQANTLSSVANQFRIMKQQIANLARVIGNLFLPIVQKVLPLINGFIVAIQRLFMWLGFNIHGDNWLKDTIDGISGGSSDDSVSDLVDDTEDVANGLDNASEKAKKLQQNLQGFDKLNVVSAPQSESGKSNGSSGSESGIDLSDEIADALADYESVWDKALEGMENKAENFADKISAYFKNMYDSIEPFRASLKKLWNEGLSKLGDFSWTALKDFYNEFLVPIGKWAFGTDGAGLTRLVDIINNSLLKIDWERLNTSLKSFWIAIEPYAEQFGEGLIDFFEDVSGLAVDVINKFPGILDKLSNALNKGDPKKARSWGYALGTLAAGLIALKGLGTIISTIAEIGNAFLSLSTGTEWEKFKARLTDRVYAYANRSSGLPLRDKPDVSGKCTVRIPAGKKVRILGRTKPGYWHVKVTLDGRVYKGYVNSRYLS